MTRLELGLKRSDKEIMEILDKKEVFLSKMTWDSVNNCRLVLEERLSENIPLYGINTGFGFLANESIEEDELGKLQINLVRSHAAGLGDEVSIEVTRTAMILLVNSLAKGYSGIRVETLKLLIDLINRDIIPVTYQIGSLGASGDLATLAHVAMVLIGEGNVRYKGQTYPSLEILEKENLSPVILCAKEGLALINGTHFITAYSLHLLKIVGSLINHNVIGTCLTLEAIRGTARAYDDKLAILRPHPGHRIIAEKLRNVLKDSDILASHKDMEFDHKVQDPYVLRCVPQILGAVYDARTYLEISVVREINSVTDNPLIFPETGEIISGGNFHAEPLALPLETVGMALVEVGNVSEKRINRLVHPQTKELPAFLASDPGVESGYMIPHYTIAALLNRARVLSNPAVTDNISVSGSQEDHVSMGMGSALKSTEIAGLIEQIVALEIYLAVRGLNMQERANSSPILEKIISQINSEIEFVKEDHYVRPKMIKAIELLKSGRLLEGMVL